MARGKKTEKQEPEKRFVVDPNYKVSWDAYCQACVGMTVDEFIADIIANPGGKYNGILYF